MVVWTRRGRGSRHHGGRRGIIGHQRPNYTDNVITAPIVTSHPQINTNQDTWDFHCIGKKVKYKSRSGWTVFPILWSAEKFLDAMLLLVNGF